MGDHGPRCLQPRSLSLPEPEAGAYAPGMVTIVVPFRFGGKSRLPGDVRDGLGLAMLSDVLEAAVAFGGRVRLVTDDGSAAVAARALGVEVVVDPGGGQGRAVEAALAGTDGVCLVVNGDLPCARPSDFSLLAIPPARGDVALVAAADGTTNALGLPSPDAFAPLYGAGSAFRFRAHAASLGLAVEEMDISNLCADVDTAEDLDAIAHRAGERTAAAAATLIRA